MQEDSRPRQTTADQSRLQQIIAEYSKPRQNIVNQSILMSAMLPASLMLFLGPRGPLRTPSSVRPSARPSRAKNSKSPLKPYKASQDLARPLI